jgi:iron(III) transport system permease protein
MTAAVTMPALGAAPSWQRQLRTPWFGLALAALALLLLFLVWPLVNLLGSSFTSRGADGASGWATMLAEPRYGKALLNTIVLGLVVTLLATLIGVPLAYLTARYDYVGKGW